MVTEEASLTVDYVIPEVHKIAIPGKLQPLHGPS